MEGKKTISQNNEKEFIKIDNSSLYLDKNTVFTFFAKANSFFDSFSVFTKECKKEFQNINTKLDFLIKDKLKNSTDNMEQTKYFLGGKNNKEKTTEDNKNHQNSKQSENAKSESPQNEKEEKEVYSKCPVDSIKKKIKNSNSNKVSTSLNSQ